MTGWLAGWLDGWLVGSLTGWLTERLHRSLSVWAGNNRLVRPSGSLASFLVKLGPMGSITTTTSMKYHGWTQLVWLVDAVDRANAMEYDVIPADETKTLQNLPRGPPVPHWWTASGEAEVAMP